MFRASIGGVIVAVKIFEEQWEHHEERSFHEQIWRIWNPGHKNVLKIMGCRLEEHFKSIVYEYAALGSLDNMLYGRGAGVVLGPNEPVLTWMQRVKIAVGVASGLKFLHEQKPPIICGRIRASNILIFNDDVAKIGGIKPLQRTPTSLGAIALAGACEFRGSANGYRAESDVFDFGVLLVELLTGEPIKDHSELQLIHRKLLLRENYIASIVDPRISSYFSAEGADIDKMSSIAVRCLDLELRPSADSLVDDLQALLGNIQDSSQQKLGSIEEISAGSSLISKADDTISSRRRGLICKWCIYKLTMQDCH